ncbi:MAG: hypothetical protein M0Q22_04870 [Sulfuritalea sp.]|nr:hypothetical protein [Sulfuritalea sp.]
MKFELSKASKLATILAAGSVVLVGCGGGGGGSADVTPTSLPSIDGTLKLGFIKKAKVIAWCGKQLDGDKLGEDQSSGAGDGAKAKADGLGQYSITPTKACSKPVEITAESQTDAAGLNITKMVDDVKPGVVADHDVPSLNLRAVIPTATPAVPVNLTMYSHAAALSAAKTDFSAASVQTANEQTAVLFFDPTANTPAKVAAALAIFNATPRADLASATSDAERALVTKDVIYASNVVTAGPGLCDIQCVVNKVSAAATVTVLANQNVIVPDTTELRALIAAGNTALATLAEADSTLTALKDAVTLAVASATTDLGNVVVDQPVTNPTAPPVTNTGIAGAKTLLAAIRDNLLGLSNDTKTGFMDVKEAAVQTDLAGVQNGVDALTWTVQAANRAATFLSDFSALSGTPPSSFGATVQDGYLRRYTNMECTYYTAGTAPDGTTSLAGAAACTSLVNVGTTQKLAVFSMKLDAASTATNKVYAYQNYLYAPASTGAQTPYSGQITSTVNASGLRTGMKLTSGKLMPLVPGATDSTATMDIGLTGDSTTGETLALTGSVTSGSSTVSLLTGSQVAYKASSATSGNFSTKLIGQIKSAAFQYDGTLDLAATATNMQLPSQPATVAFSGKISTLANGVATEFFSGGVTYNQSTLKSSVSGKVTNGTAVTQVGINLDGSSTAAVTSVATYGFSAPAYSLTIVVKKDKSATITASDGTTLERSVGGTMVMKDGATVPVKIADISSAGLVSFTDGTSVQLTGPVASLVAN